MVQIRADGLAAMESCTSGYGYPTPEQVAAADAAVDEEERLIAEMLEVERRDVRPP